VKRIIFTLLILINSYYCKSQYIVTSNTGYSVILKINMIDIIKPTTCQWGYNYNILLEYDIQFVGDNIPSGLWILQGVFNCGDDFMFFDLPNNGGVGTIATSSNPWRGLNDCNSLNLESLNCGEINLIILGPGIDTDTVKLPIELISFDGTYNKDDEVIYIKWVTISENNNEYFDLLKSSDGINFEKIFSVPGQYKSNELITYSYIDYEIEYEKNYYKLNQFDFDGKYNESKIIVVETDVKSCHVDINKDWISIKTMDESLEYTISIIDYTGKIIFTKPYCGYNNIKLNNNLSSGMYIILVECDDYITLKKFIID